MEANVEINNWKNKFSIIWTGQLFSILSSSIAQFSMVLWIGMETGSAEALAYAAIAGLLPQILLGPFAGVFIDRWNRKWTMIGADFFVAICSAIISLFFYLDIVELWSIYILLMLRSVGSAFHAPAIKSIIPVMAPKSKLVRIAGINEIIQSISIICGPMLGAICLLTFGMSTVMLLDVAGAIIACTSLLFVSIPHVTNIGKSAKSILQDMKEGATAILRNKGMSWLMASEVVVNFFVMPIVAVMPLMTLHYFHGSAYQVSLIEGLYGIGLLVGGVILSVWNPKLKKVTLIIFGFSGLGLVLALCGALPSSFFITYAVLTIGQGLAVPLFTGPFTVLIQTQFESVYLGRVFALYSSLSQFPAIIGLLFAGFIADEIGVEKLFLFGGIVVMLAGVSLFFIPAVQRVEHHKY
ncbi:MULTISPECIES: MFS transporter [unclassified Sphingobacterium]|uniref:MFS transporter n=1 Tax=unclassified Sphingobacterium TaxID=2609468 RepID=UPI0010D92372|nr:MULTISPECIES: MFS transporter [unclassified Sphingobacterium]MCS3552547.1 DHA3 family macrolide efflux protein-like MFS transporter [Sphingobacterium sp. JUb21]TCR10691.1 DHA3 family macrolide efflux protein-like MFS transporter [Sphingobacterium sp. JUb20]